MGRRGYFGRPGLSIKKGMEVLRDLADHFDLHGGLGGKPPRHPLVFGIDAQAGRTVLFSEE
jgi:hypothetical protein